MDTYAYPEARRLRQAIYHLRNSIGDINKIAAEVEQQITHRRPFSCEFPGRQPSLDHLGPDERKFFEYTPVKSSVIDDDSIILSAGVYADWEARKIGWPYILDRLNGYLIEFAKNWYAGDSFLNELPTEYVDDQTLALINRQSCLFRGKLHGIRETLYHALPSSSANAAAVPQGKRQPDIAQFLMLIDRRFDFQAWATRWATELDVFDGKLECLEVPYATDLRLVKDKNPAEADKTSKETASQPEEVTKMTAVAWADDCQTWARQNLTQPQRKLIDAAAEKFPDPLLLADIELLFEADWRQTKRPEKNVDGFELRITEAITKQKQQDNVAPFKVTWKNPNFEITPAKSIEIE